MLLALLLALAAALLASPSDDPRLLSAAPTDAAISVDGRLDEAVWPQAEAATDFVQFEPDEGDAASQRADVRVLYGPNALYVGATLYDDEPDRIRRSLSRRDDLGDADYFIVSIDGYLDRRTAYVFGLSAAGVQADGVQTGQSTDTSWDGVWTSAVRVTPDGWVAELAIPYSMLRFNRAAVQTWGIQFERRIARSSERSYWQPVTRAEEGQGLIQGRLTDLQGISPRRTIQVQPYTLSEVRRFEAVGSPGTPESEFIADVGADLKLGLSSNLILDATVNPDFGQVDADPAELNLTTFETFFDERRPFFLEGTTVFDYTIDSGRDGRLLYTRRIGAVDPIITATKLTGRTNGGLSAGALGALTGRDFDPQRFYGTARVKQEFGARSAVGLGLAYYDERLASLSSVRSDARSVVGGTDWDIRMGAGTFRWDGALTLSTRADTDVPSETGLALYTGLDKIRGNTTWGSGLRVYSDTFRPDDLGRLNQVDLVRVGLGGGTYLRGGRRIGPFRRVRVSLFGDQTWSYRGLRNRGFSGSASSDWELLSFSEIGVRASFGGLGGVDVRETRGLGPIRNRRSLGFNVDYESDSRRRFVYEPEVSIDLQEGGGFGWGTELDLEWDATDRFDLALDLEYLVRDGFVAWTANEAFIRTDTGYLVGAVPNEALPAGAVPLAGAGLDAVFDGIPFYDGSPGRYFLPVFGERDTREFDVSLRANVVFRPNLSLQLYGQLFAARGRFRDFRLLAGEDDLRDFSAYPKRRDLSVQALVANTVLRWEYRPGSTLFVVWSHTRSAGLDAVRFADDPVPPPFDTSTATQLGDTFGLFPENVALVKLSHLIMR